MKKKIVISGINLFEGGPLSIYYDCMDALINNGYVNEYDITCFVHKRILFEKYTNFFNIIELPESRSSYLKRFYYEYIYFYNYSKDKNIDVWISLHDITPNVKSKRLFTYCHNPTPFYKATIKDLLYNKNTFFMSILYKYIYQINIKKNSAVIVQQDWLRKEFMERYKTPNIIVAHPSTSFCPSNKNTEDLQSEKYCFLFPAFPRVFKNFEIICEAAKRLEDDSDKFEIWLTMNGLENKYAKYIKTKYGCISSIKWLGLIPREKMSALYNECDCVLFPSKLETWGLPITEAKEFNKPIMLVNLPYAHETIGNYDKVAFFDSDSPDELVVRMKSAIFHEDNCFGEVKANTISEPYSSSWEELCQKLLKSEE